VRVEKRVFTKVKYFGFVLFSLLSSFFFLPTPIKRKKKEEEKAKKKHKKKCVKTRVNYTSKEICIH